MGRERGREEERERGAGVRVLIREAFGRNGEGRGSHSF